MLRIVEREAEHEGNRPALEDLAREGARRMLRTALDAEVAEYVARHQSERDENGHAVVVRNGRGRPRTVVTGSGTIEVESPRVNDRREGQRFASRILPPYMRRTPKIDEVLPILYLRGLSTGDFREAIPALLGEDAAGLSATTITRLTNQWEAEHKEFQGRDLSEREYVYVWCDGIHVNVRLEDDRVCLLIMLGVRQDGTKELIAVEDGYRESKESRRSSDAGCIGWATCSTNYPSASRAGRNRHCMRSWMLKLGLRLSEPVKNSKRSTGRSTRRRLLPFVGTGRSSSPSTTTRLSIGYI